MIQFPLFVFFFFIHLFLLDSLHLSVYSFHPWFLGFLGLISRDHIFCLPFGLISDILTVCYFIFSFINVLLSLLIIHAFHVSFLFKFPAFSSFSIILQCQCCWIFFTLHFLWPFLCSVVVTWPEGSISLHCLNLFHFFSVIRGVHKAKRKCVALKYTKVQSYMFEVWPDLALSWPSLFQDFFVKGKTPEQINIAHRLNWSSRASWHQVV